MLSHLLFSNYFSYRLFIFLEYKENRTRNTEEKHDPKSKDQKQ